MDFKSLMAAQISKAKAPLATNGGTGSSAAAAPSSTKFVRRAELEAERQKAYAEEQARLEREREERAAKKRKAEEEEAERAAQREAKLRKLSEATKARREAEQREEERRRRKRLGLPELPADTPTGTDGDDDDDDDDDDGGAEAGEDIEDDQLRAKLRQLDEPAALFGESHAGRLRRYYRRVKKAAEPAAAGAGAGAGALSTGPIPHRLAPVEEREMLLTDEQLARSQSRAGRAAAWSADEVALVYRQIAAYVGLLLDEWSTALARRPREVRESAAGRAAHASYAAVVRDLTPLYRRLEEGSLDANLLAPLCEIVAHIQRRQYVRANDAYLRLSIGRAAWPIGVTMVGIHERSAREKLHGGDKQAHIMADEVTRKMLQSLKRCISFAQTRWPPDDLGQLMG